MEKRIQLSKYSLNVQFIGTEFSDESSKPVLIFLHEALGSIIQWKLFPVQLCQKTQLPGIVIERSGHGKSDPLQHPRTKNYLHEYTYELHEALRELLPLKKKIILIGHSDGGTIALLYGSLFPENLQKTITIAAHTFVEPETVNGIPPTVTAYEHGKLDGLKHIHGEKTDALFYSWANTWLSDEFYSWDIRQEISGLHCSVLAIQGQNDQYGTVLQLESIREAIPTTQIAVLADCAHHPHLEKQSEVIELVAGFLK
ncbi:MAG: alpha/beta hydrolase [Fluviicola sp.]|nr:alpha/beta hydrolase [Fluviicola sp.]